ncbi:MAG: hypothetical protein R3F61_28075 [Myxococcota bacterium]
MSAISAFRDWLASQPDAPGLGACEPTATGPLAPLFAVFDGQTDGPALLEHHHLLSRAEAETEKTMMDALAADEGWPDTWWSAHWHPFGSDGAGQLLVVDDRDGRVLEFLHDDDARPEHGDSLEAWFARIVAEIEAGERLYDPDCGVVSPAYREEHRAARQRFRAGPARFGAATPGEKLKLELKKVTLVLVPTFAVLGVGMAFDLGAGPTSIAATATALVMTGVGTWLGWIEWDPVH